MTVGAPKPRPEKENIASWQCRFEIEGQGCAPRMRALQARTSKLHSDRCGKVPKAMSRTVPHGVAFEYSNVNPASKSPKHMTAAETRFRAFWKLPSESGIMRKIPEQESSRTRRWWPDSGMMRMIQTQESTLLVRFWNNRQETGSRFLKFT